MFKRSLSLLLCLVFVFLVGCGAKEEVKPSTDAGTSSEEKAPEPVLAVNPLTGIKNMDPEIANNRPVAITVNNISIAQPVQTGLGDANIVYETEVEGGITRLVAVYQDISGIEKIGTVRSARYAFCELAMGHNAIYIHHGQDSFHAPVLLNKMDRLVLGENNGGARIKNGLATEHTLYAYGDKLWETIDSKFNTENNNTNTWVNFADEKKELKFTNVANSVSVAFSNSYKSTFKYDVNTGRYIRYFNGTPRNDYVSGESEYFKNIFVLNTTIRSYSNCSEATCKGTHKQVMLNSGSGYYIVNGTYKPIKWSKGNASNGFTFTNEDGTPVEVNAGNSWVCIAKMDATPIFE